MGTNVLTVSPEVDAALGAAVDAAGVLAGEVESLAAPQLAMMVPAVAKVIARFEAVRLAAVRAADRANVAASAGMVSTADWMAATTGEKRARPVATWSWPTAWQVCARSPRHWPRATCRR